MTDLPEAGPWAKAKLDSLGKYLHAYTEIMKGQSRWCKGFIYIDAFAGPGRHRLRQDPELAEMESHLLPFDGDEAELDSLTFMEGSPRVALNLKTPFTRYVFIERSPSRVFLLNQLKVEFPSRDIRIVNQDCNAYFTELLARSIDWQRWRAVAFLDPFGMQVHWDTMEALARTNSIEVFVNFPAWMAIQRLLPQSAQLRPGWEAKLDSYFGTHDWFDLTYSSPSTLDLFGAESLHKTGGTKDLVAWYRNRLEDLFGYASRAAIVRGNRNQPLYCLIHAGPNRNGAKIADQVLRGLGDWIT